MLCLIFYHVTSSKPIKPLGRKGLLSIGEDEGRNIIEERKEQKVRRKMIMIHIGNVKIKLTAKQETGRESYM